MHPSRSLSRFLPLSLAAWLFATGAFACTIPVFRYALERWEADPPLVVVYYDGQLTEVQETALAALAASTPALGPPLVHIVRYDMADPKLPAGLSLSPPKSDQPLPWAEVRTRFGPTSASLHWQGPLDELLQSSDIFMSPAREEIARRLLSGDSAVWVLVAPEDQLPAKTGQLQKLLDAVTSELVLPQGVGLPGSELYAPIPLQIRFSVLAIAHDDPHEQRLLKQLAASTNEWRTDAAFVIPVFGRFRGLEVFPLEDVDELLVRDVGEFLCGACSCRVKQANPGFDIIAAVPWNQRLFGTATPPDFGGPPGQSQPFSLNSAADEPQYLPIPEGSASTEPEVDGSASDTTLIASAVPAASSNATGSDATHTSHLPQPAPKYAASSRFINPNKWLVVACGTSLVLVVLGLASLFFHRTRGKGR